jgi:hypothetical protein
MHTGVHKLSLKTIWKMNVPYVVKVFVFMLTIFVNKKTDVEVSRV